MSKVADLCQKQHMTSRQLDLCTATEGEEEIGNPFANNQRKVLPYFPVTEEILAGVEGDLSVYSFDRHTKYHCLHSSALNFVVPAIRVREEFVNSFRICWPANLGHQIIQRAEFLIDGVPWATFDGTATLDHLAQFYFNAGTGVSEKRELEEKSKGNMEHLTNWSESLPSEEIIVPQPWFYTQSTMLSFFLRKLYPGIYETVSQNYIFRLKIGELLRIQQCVNLENWKDVRFEEFIHVLDGVPHNRELAVPRLRCQFLNFGESTVNYLRECANVRTRTYVVNNFATHRSNSLHRLGSTVRLSLKNGHPTKAILWSATNVSAQNVNDRSRVTTRIAERNGRCPIKTNTLSFFSGDEQFLFRELSSAHFCRGIYLRSFPSAPVKEGYLGFPISLEVAGLDGDSTIEFSPDKNYSLQCTLHERAPNESDDEFMLEATTIECHKFSIEEGEENGRFKLKMHN